MWDKERNSEHFPFNQKFLNFRKGGKWQIPEMQTGMFGRMESALCVLAIRAANQHVLLQNEREKPLTQSHMAQSAVYSIDTL